MTPARLLWRATQRLWRLAAPLPRGQGFGGRYDDWSRNAMCGRDARGEGWAKNCSVARNTYDDVELVQHRVWRSRTGNRPDPPCSWSLQSWAPPPTGHSIGPTCPNPETSPWTGG